MLTIEDIKKGCEFAEGFSFEIVRGMEAILHPYFFGFDFVDQWNKDNNSIEYDSFLNRVIEGINNSESYGIEQNWLSVKAILFGGENRYFNIDNKLNKNLKCIKYPIDKAKEQAIKYIFENMEIKK